MREHLRCHGRLSAQAPHRAGSDNDPRIRTQSATNALRREPVLAA